ncbi:MULTISPECIES: LysR family transcriptional regulator [unclassified Sulfitobacter]|uniref:LysR family transcriptional regulator n=1 Tax=unclassified Sulfitobacter TaxID=196795 RepID=UPI001593A066|nr:LysR family transcriptional regulator [Sulfitobacter sp. HGT1]
MNFARKLKPHQLKLIVKISETAKLQFAAESIGLSQPAASRTLAEIETDIGAPLFIRSAKGMYPTPIGEAFVRHSQSILSGFETLEAEVKGLGRGEMGEVKVGSVTGPAICCLVPAILEIKKATPKLEATIEVGPSTELVRRLEKGHFDFIIARLPHEYDSRAFYIRPARSEVVSLVVRASHPLVKKAKVSLEDLAQFEWAIQERGSPIRTAVEEAFAANGTQIPSHITNTSSLLVMLGLLEQSDTIATLAEEVANVLTSAALGANLIALNLDRAITVSPYFVIMEKDKQLSRAAEHLLDAVLSRF